MKYILTGKELNTKYRNFIQLLKYSKHIDYTFANEISIRIQDLSILMTAEQLCYVGLSIIQYT